MADTLHLQIVTPDKLLVNEEADSVQLPGKSGELGILPGHAPLLSELMSGELSFTKGGTTQYFAVSWGFAEVLPDKVTVLADAAERAQDVNVARAQEAKRRAEEALRQTSGEVDYEALELALRRADARLQVAAHAGQGAGAAH